ncbi:MAG: hypothetical protein LC114_18050 [Bryobacterales bacterium]|nr:hypothetical protein [Bryobacterales bacterium]
MKQLILFAIGAFLGVLVGASTVIGWMGEGRATELTVRELKLAAADGQVAARLFADQRGAILEFIDPASKGTAIELGVRESGRFLRVFSPEGKHVASIQSSPPDGASTLYLGDTILETRVLLGAIRSDVMYDTTSQEGIEEWALQIRDPVHRHAVVQLLARPGSGPGQYRGSLQLLKPTATK